ncbi:MULTISPECIES: flagellar protein FlhE [unclassified Serratia (in: enterobacteria)]|uniref:flagellar protein FlhE n=1 Tax=unclassified Serratia (in: enterobacteria) TaxID=2647522 RepID=UPI0004FF6D90|nr:MULTISPECIES: flagellar protein FlhE [unclassified Serratia (in: enterobacteria)]KFK96373.1 flagellar protein flhE [Serratia sp. Ag2]KFK99848.1 flagellar protein flhE [Serratia sp. Ag1]
MKICCVVLLLLSPFAAQAVSGSWNASNDGIELGYGQLRAESQPLRPFNVLPGNSARITSISWRYQLLSAEPAGLQVQLCTLARCIALGAGSGRSEALNGEPADSEFRFVYYVQARGTLNPPLRVISHQVIVNYQSGPVTEL